MALTRVTLTSAITASQLTFGVSSTATGFPPVGSLFVNQPLWVNDELMFVVGVPAPNTLVVRSRGSDGTAASAHDVNAPCVTSATPSDFPALAPGASILQPLEQDDVVVYGQDGAITVPIQETKMAIAKSTAIALTLGAPSLAINGVRLNITSLTAAAHVISAAALINNGASGSPFSTITFPAFVGASLILEAWNGLWNVIASSGVIAYT